MDYSIYALQPIFHFILVEMKDCAGDVGVTWLQLYHLYQVHHK